MIKETYTYIAVADTGIRQWGGRLYWRGGIFQRRKNLFKIGGGRLCKIINGGGGVQSLATGGGGGGAVPYDGEGGGAVPYDGGGRGVQSLTTGGGGQSTFGTQKIRFANRYSITERA